MRHSAANPGASKRRGTEPSGNLSSHFPFGSEVVVQSDPRWRTAKSLRLPSRVAIAAFAVATRTPLSGRPLVSRTIPFTGLSGDSTTERLEVPSDVTRTGAADETLNPLAPPIAW